MARFKITCAVITAVLAGLAAYTTVGAEQPNKKDSGAKLRVGTFDSRAVAIAHVRSEAFARHLKKIRAEYKKAKAAGDEKRVKALEDQGSAEQELVHKQGFGILPVGNILKKIKGKIPEIAKQADVDLIISRWDLVYQRTGVEFVDVTDLMVQPFDPDKSTLKTIKEVLKRTPIPIEELKSHKHLCE